MLFSYCVFQTSWHCAFFCVHSLMLYSVKLFPNLFHIPSVVSDGDRFEKGIVVFDTPETFHPPPVSFFDYLAKTLDTFIHFFHFWPSVWDKVHIISAVFFFDIAFQLCTASLIIAVKKDITISEHISVVYSWLYMIAINGLCALTVLDHVWRYRLSTIPFFAIMSSVSMKGKIK
ncbi:membrane protein [Candidatus Magnetobacterium bavaricum]|uniref:Membrane protein n=1 Tax=Candidatus Magnetobacterium bavaricum TaxID=29290 RepID=A0A0F3GX40_9BACT|nr:membrane protein [Candidatus Magnetobacterium bavaricum]